MSQAKDLRFQPYIYENIKSLDLSEPSIIPRDHLADSLNMVRRDDGLWENRKGIKQFGEDVGSGAGIHSLHFWKTGTGQRYLTVGTDTDLYSYAEGTDYNDGTFTNEKTLTSDKPWEAISYRDILVLCNGDDDIQTSTDNSTFTDRSGANIFNFKICSQANDFCFYSDIPGDEDKGFFTSGAPAQPWVTDSNNTVNIDIGNSDNITACVSLGAQIIVSKEKRTYAIDLASLERTTIDWGGGAGGPRAMLQTQTNSVYSAGLQGIYTIARTQIGNNQLFGTPESELIQPLYNKIDDFRVINTVYTFDQNYAIFSCPINGERLALVKNLDYPDPVWTYFTGINSSDWVLYEDDDNGLHVLYADESTDKIWELFVGRDDNGAPILSKMAFKNDDFDFAGQNKYVSTIDITGYISADGVWIVEIFKDNDFDTPYKTEEIRFDTDAQLTQSFLGLGSQPLGGSPLGGIFGATDDLPVSFFKKRINVHDECERMQVVLTNSQKDVRVVFDKMTVYAALLPYDYYNNQNIT
jgi:hypothetical protein